MRSVLWRAWRFGARNMLPRFIKALGCVAAADVFYARVERVATGWTHRVRSKLFRDAVSALETHV